MSTARQPDIEFDPLSETFFNDPSGLYRALRDNAPIFYDEKLDIWVVSRYEDVAAGMKDWETFSSAGGVTLHQVLTPDFDGSNVMMMMDPPQHTRLRALVSRAFTPRAISDSEPLVRDVVRRYLTPLERRQSFDAVTEFADAFPVDVICTLLGVPIEDGPQINEWVSTLLHREPGDPSMTPAGMEAAIASGTYFHDLATRRRENPTTDMISRLCDATIETDQGERVQLELREVAGFIILIAGAGTETVTKLIGSAIVLLDRHPDLRGALLQDRSLVPALVDETMRWAPPAQYMCRTTTRDAHLPSGVVPKGARAMFLIGSAMRDPRIFPEPDELRLDRPTSVPLGFGYGVHACLGASLARLESRVAIDEFLDRWPNYVVEREGLTRVSQENTAGYATVPVRTRAGH